MGRDRNERWNLEDQQGWLEDKVLSAAWACVSQVDTVSQGQHESPVQAVVKGWKGAVQPIAGTEEKKWPLTGRGKLGWLEQRVHVWGLGKIEGCGWIILRWAQYMQRNVNLSSGNFWTEKGVRKAENHYRLKGEASQDSPGDVTGANWHGSWWGSGR